MRRRDAWRERRMRMVFTAFGSAGDVLPVLSIAEAASKRGHDCVALLNPAQLGLAAARGVRAEGFGEAWDASTLRDRPGWLDAKRGSLAMLRELMAPRTASLVPALRDLLERFGADVVVHHQASFGVGWVTEALGIARVMVSVAPSGWVSVKDPSRYPGMPDRDSYPGWAVRLGGVFGKRAVNRAVDPVLNGIRREMGMEAGRAFMFEEQFGGALNVGMWSPVFRGAAGDDPARSVVAGFPRAATAVVEGEMAEGTERVREFLGGEGALLTLGTTAVHAGVDVVGLADEVARGVGRRVVVLGGGGMEERAGGRVLLAGFVPHGLVMGDAGCVVHHGGIGTTGAVLRAGVPSVVVPFTHDQPDNARRVRMLGCGVVLERRRLNGARLVGAVRGVLSGGYAERCAGIATRLEDEDGGEGACVAIERAVRSRVLTTR